MTPTPPSPIQPREPFLLKMASGFIPVAVSVSVFFVAYNNCAAGKLILAFIAVGNLLVWLIPTKWFLRYIHVMAVRLSSLYIAVICASWLALEMLFPSLLPAEYAQLMDLTKVFREGNIVPASAVDTVFENEDQEIHVKRTQATFGQARRISWHRPGEPFQYHGYDPNSGKTYLNRFFWNSRGYFDHDRSLVKPDNTKRVVVIGDSYVEAVQAPLMQTFHKRLEASLDAKPGSSPGVAFQVIALGNSGAGQAANLRVLQQEGLAYQPDLVIFTLCSNDFCDDDPALKRQLVLVSGEFGPLTRGLARRGLMATVFAARRIESMWRNRIIVSPELLQWSAEELPAVETAWQRTLDYVNQAKMVCDRAGVGFLLVYLGAEIEVNYRVDPEAALSALRRMGSAHATIPWDMERSVKRVQRYCAEHDIKFISLLEPLARAQAQTKKRVFGDHYTMFGHEIAGQVLACVVRKCLRDEAARDFTDCQKEEAQQ
ncbi:MAG: SGNH/GDSL hydrolase family protein [Desulfomonilaceae bacterium]